jgi:hypothetical protein
MSGSRPPNKDELAKNTVDDLSDENEEKQKKAKLDHPSDPPAASLTNVVTVPSSSTSTASTSINLPSAKARQLSLLPRQFLPKTLASSSSSSSSLTTSTPTTSSAPSLTSSLITPTVITKTGGYIQLENALAKIGDIANYIAPIAKKNNKTDDDCFAVSYGLIVIAEMIDVIKQYKSTVYIPYIKPLGIDCKFPSDGEYSLKNTLEVILPIRIILADHFIRVEKYLHMKTVFELGNDIAKLAALNIQNEDIENPFNNKSTMWLVGMGTTFVTKQIENKPVSYVDRVHRIFSALKNVEALYADDPTLSSVPSIFAASMLVVIAGTCAREISRAKDERLTKFFITPDGKEVKEQLELLNDIRDDLAHHKGHNTLEFLSKTLKSINMQENSSQETEKITYLDILVPYLKKVYAALGHSLEATSLNTPEMKP